ncbi:MAG: phosphoglucosamine mutase [Planctomycetota bacterium]|jgi:phosphoglucosamine mutase|nr:phosphoglucosamine mutase [Planctomycetota bacterium]MDP6369806.1 phosphoglucosamine mutase [Planctomycetota bacterium]MDP6518434.1 phosphoglucosamine mutase [Planctomycetota bacterium]MDP6955768.1 phosphoglucosamine mutase [Planctomycetota bacterium]
MSEPRIFGTDGIRGRAGEGWLTVQSVSALGRSIGAILGRRKGSKQVLLGHDGRRSASSLSQAITRGLAASGFSTTTAGLIPTPALAILTRLRPFQLGIMVSASHNPAEDNGIKVFSGEGEKLSDELELRIENHLRRHPEPINEGPLPERDTELEMAYLVHLLEGAGQGLKLDGLPLVLDCANGAASRVAPRAFGRLGAQVTALAAEPDGDNINKECGSTHMIPLQREVRTQGARIGIALDGDADRCLLVDEQGELVNGDAIMAILASHMASTGQLRRNAIVATVMSNRGLHRALREANVDVTTVGVGDRQVVERMRSDRVGLGGEQSGHIIFGDDNYFIGDGTLTALKVLRVMQETGQALSELASIYRPYPQVLLNTEVSRKPRLEQLPRVAASVREIEDSLGEDGRVLLRYSGTEPLARIMVEGPDKDTILAQAQELMVLIEEEIGVKA